MRDFFENERSCGPAPLSEPGAGTVEGYGGSPMLITLETLLALAKKAGVKLTPDQLGKEKLQTKFVKVTPRVVARLEKDGMTPKDLSDSNAEKRQLIRAAEFVLWKETVRSITGKSTGSGQIADVIRDRHDDQVVPAVMPQVTAEMTTEALVQAVAAAELEQTL